MKFRNIFAGLALGAALGAAGTAQAGGGLGIDFYPLESLPLPASAPYYDLGWSFTANSNVSVIGLGSYAGPAGYTFPQAQQVGLWTSGGALLASTYVTGSETPVGYAPWVFESIAPVELHAGQTYVVASQGGADYAFALGTVNPMISYVTDLFAPVGTNANNPLVFPTTTDSFQYYAWFGGNVMLGSIPEPSTWLMMLAGFAGLAFAGYRTRKAAVAA